MRISRTNIAPTLRPDSEPNSSEADVIFIKEWANRYSAKQGSALTSMTPNGFKKLQSGDNAISYEKLTFWLKRDDDFRTAYFQRCGGRLLVDPNTAVALGRAINAVMRGEFSE